jgi:uncharacterized protein with LGFP repeats
MKEEMFMKYMQRGGGEQLGEPTTAERIIKDKNGLVGCYRDFDRGSIYWTAKTGARIVEDKIFQYWKDKGAHNSGLGYPVSDQKDSSDGRKVYTRFQHGTIYYFPEKDTYVVHGVGKNLRNTWRWIAIVTAMVLFIATAAFLGYINHDTPLKIVIYIAGLLLSPLAGRLIAFIWPSATTDDDI